MQIGYKKYIPVPKGMLMRVKSWFLMALGCCAALTAYGRAHILLESPDHRLVLHFDPGTTHQNAQYYLYYDQEKVIDLSDMGLGLQGGRVLGKDVVIGEIRRSSYSGNWKPVYGQRNQYPDVYNQMTVTLNTRQTGKPELIIIFRCYDEGVAFRYQVPALKENDTTVITRELTAFRFPQNVQVWASSTAQGKIHKTSVDHLNGPSERPLLVEMDTTTYLALGEAAVVNFARMKFVPGQGTSHAVVASLDGTVVKKGAFLTPWRYILVARRPEMLLAHHYLLLNLNDPDRLDHVSWIRPGKVIREITLTTQGALGCIDFAAKHHLQYIEFDAGWYGAENSDTADATRVSVDPVRSKGPLDLHEVIRYGKTKGIGVILYVNRKALERQLDTLLPLYESWGVKGLKFGFVDVGTQKANTWLLNAVRKAAQYHLMVDIHDEYRPTGYSRTYPNLLTQEGVRGDEESPTNDVVLKTLFTRMIAGAADQTNCYFSPKVKQMGSHASQLAKAVCIYSPLQFLFWYDQPAVAPMQSGVKTGTKTIIEETPELKFFDHLPTVWDDTKILGGYPGQYIIMARRKGQDWFVGGINGEQGRQFDVDLRFLDPGIVYQAVIYSDDPTVKTSTAVSVKTIRVNSKSRIREKVLAQNGIAVWLSPKR